MKATTLEFARQNDDAGRLLSEIRNRWPEWPGAWLASGIILDTHRQFEEARGALETAVALGSHRTVTYYYLADAYRALGRAPEAEAVLKRINISPSRDAPAYLTNLFEGDFLGEESNGALAH